MRFRPLPTLLALLALTACASAPAAKTFGVSKMLLSGTLNDRGEITQESAVFAPGQKEIHVHAFTENVTRSAEVTGAWWYLTGDRKIYESGVTVTALAPVAKFSLQSTKPWPVGSYAFVLSLGNEELKRAEFAVQEPGAGTGLTVKINGASPVYNVQFNTRPAN